MNKISLAEISDSANKIRTLNSELDDTLKSITNSMNELSSIWDSQGAETLVARFKRIANRFVVEDEVIEDYCKFLDLIVQTYDAIKED